MLIDEIDVSMLSIPASAAQCFLEATDQLERDVRPQQACHVLDRDRMGAHILDTLREIDPEVDRMHRAHGVGNRALRVLAQGHGRLDRDLQVARVVERIEDPEHVDAVLRGTLDELLDQVVGVMPVAENVLPAEQHLLRRIRHRRLQLADALPRIFAEVADASVECRPAPRFDGPESDLVQLVADRQHVFDAHTGCEQALMPVAKYELRNPEWLLVAQERIPCVYCLRRCAAIAAAIAATSSSACPVGGASA
jgi:hypothetical protein